MSFTPLDPLDVADGGLHESHIVVRELRALAASHPDIAEALGWIKAQYIDAYCRTDPYGHARAEQDELLQEAHRLLSAGDPEAQALAARLTPYAVPGDLGSVVLRGLVERGVVPGPPSTWLIENTAGGDGWQWRVGPVQHPLENVTLGTAPPRPVGSPDTLYSVAPQGWEASEEDGRVVIRAGAPA